MPKKRVLIIYATAGAGHLKAAMAVKKAFDGAGEAFDVDVVDSLKYMSAFFRWTYPRIYLFMVKRIPAAWGFGYYILDNKIVYALTAWLRHLTNWINSRALAGFLRERQYDVIVSTHFLANDVISMEGKKKIGARLINVVTDLRMHSFWYAEATDKYVVACELTKEELVDKYGVSGDKIEVLGIPIDPGFSKVMDKEALIDKIGIKRGLCTILVGSGGFGVGPIEELVRSFKGISIPVQLLVVCGKNDQLCLTVGGMEEEVGIPVKSYGFIDNMDELMEVSDIIVSKTGGMMSSEALAKSLPIIGISPIPGQEMRNFEILIKMGVALDGREISGIPGMVTALYADKARMDDMRQKIVNARRPNAAIDIARLAMDAAKG
jgi:processive 1,2-diacylglycerol beta-glucosyltransferase